MVVWMGECIDVYADEWVWMRMRGKRGGGNG